MKKILPFILFTVCLLPSCIILKENRIVKRKTREYRDSPVVLSAYGDTPFYGLFLTLRENGRFEYESSGMLKTFGTGIWTINNDTIHIAFINFQLDTTITDDLVLNRTNNTVHFVSNKSSSGIMQLMVNKL